MDRKTLTNEWSRYFHGFDYGYWITLNSTMRADSPEDQYIPRKYARLTDLVDAFVLRLNHNCFGRRFERGEEGARLKGLMACETGKKDGMIHCHLIAAHDGSVTRSLPKIREIVTENWNKVNGFVMSESATTVEAIDNIRDRVWYCTKQSTNYQFRFNTTNIIPV